MYVYINILLFKQLLLLASLISNNYCSYYQGQKFRFWGFRGLCIESGRMFLQLHSSKCISEFAPVTTLICPWLSCSYITPTSEASECVGKRIVLP